MASASEIRSIINGRDPKDFGADKTIKLTKLQEWSHTLNLESKGKKKMELAQAIVRSLQVTTSSDTANGSTTTTAVATAEINPKKKISILTKKDNDTKEPAPELIEKTAAETLVDAPKPAQETPPPTQEEAPKLEVKPEDWSATGSLFSRGLCRARVWNNGLGGPCGKPVTDKDNGVCGRCHNLFVKCSHPMTVKTNSDGTVFFPEKQNGSLDAKPVGLFLGMDEDKEGKILPYLYKNDFGICNHWGPSAPKVAQLPDERRILLLDAKNASKEATKAGTTFLGCGPYTYQVSKELGGAKKKKRSADDLEGAAKKKKKNNGPKRPQNAFMIFSNEKRASLKEAHAHAGVSEIAKILGGLWKNLSPEEKAPYLKLHEQDKVRYQEEKKAFDEENGQQTLPSVVLSEPEPEQTQPAIDMNIDTELPTKKDNNNDQNQEDDEEDDDEEEGTDVEEVTLADGTVVYIDDENNAYSEDGTELGVYNQETKTLDRPPEC